MKQKIEIRLLEIIVARTIFVRYCLKYNLLQSSAVILFLCCILLKAVV